MRNQRFVAVHRGGSLTKDNHRALMRWARQCAEHVLPLWGGNVDGRLLHALHIAEEWEQGNVPTGAAMKASLGAHAAAREASNPVATAVARAVGQAVATAHMADHSLGGALYALKALKQAGRSTDDERAWQVQQLQELPPDIVELVLTTLAEKEKSFRLL